MSTTPPSSDPGSGWGQPASQPAGGAAGWGQTPPGGAVTGGLPAGAVLSGWWRRVGAWILDGLIVGVPWGILTVLVGGYDSTGSAAGASASFSLQLTGIGYLMQVLLYGVLILYAGYFYAQGHGQTLGKKALGIRTVRDDGQPTTFGLGALREVALKNFLFGTIGAIICGLGFLANFLWPLPDKENQTLHDKIVKTHVVRA